MVDFVQQSVVKTATREIPTPIPDATTFTGIIDNVISTNPFECAAYERGGVTYPAVRKSYESYGCRVEFVNGDVTVGSVNVRAGSVADLNAVVSAIRADTTLAAAMGGTAAADVAGETFTARIACHDPNGEDYVLSFSRKSVRVSSYEDNAILAKIETWADGVPALN